MELKLFRKLSSTLLCIVFLCACANHSTSPYKPANNAGFGYQETQLGENYYHVEFTISNSARKAQDYALLRAAELTDAQGYDWFVVLKRDTLTEQDKTPLARRFNSRPVITRSCGLLGCRDNVQNLPNPAMGESITNKEVTAILEIKFGKGVRPALDNSYDVREIDEKLRMQYPDVGK